MIIARAAIFLSTMSSGAILLCILLIHNVFSLQVKHLSGPPSEFPLHRTPNPAQVETVARSATINLWFNPQSNGLLSSTTFPQDGVDEFVLSYASPIASATRVELLREGNPIPKDQIHEIKSNYEVGDGADEPVAMTTYLVTGCKQSTKYTFNVYKDDSLVEDELATLMANPRPDAVLTFVNNDGIKIHTHMQSYLLKVGSNIGLNTFVIDENKLAMNGESVHIDKANMEVIFPDGHVTNYEMHDDGKSGDLLASDGVFGAHIQAKVPGDYIVSATVDGTFSDANVPFQRSTQHIIEVSKATIELKGSATMRVIDEKRVGIQIDVVNTVDQPRLRGYAEVYGKDKTGASKAACWIGGVTPIQDNSNVELVLDLNWLSLAGLTGPLTIENVVLNDINSNFPVAAHQGAIAVTNSERIKFGFQSVNAVTEEMRFGVNPHGKPMKSRDSRNLKKSSGVPSLLMLPGYCTEINPFQPSATHFSNAFFPVKKGNFAHDEYANIMAEIASTQGMDEFSIIGHSQGGLVATHLLNFYWSGMANASDGRLIQTVASPFQGCSAAGSSANLGAIFGIGCGSNTDLSRDGAVNWLQGISMETRQHVHYYTATYQQGNFFGDWCSLPMNLVLEWPNDGVTELKYAHLPGAKNMGNKEKWCHSTEMVHPPVCNDEARNKEMNEAAAR